MIRKILHKDVSNLFKVRVATRENALSLSDLEELGITEESIHSAIDDSHCGWLCELDGKTVGFAMGDFRAKELTVIALLPEYENQGIGAKLLNRVEAWLSAKKCNKIWLTTDIDINLRAYGFYIKHGWVDNKIKNGDRHMVKILNA